MITLDFTEKQLGEIYDEMLSNTSSSARKKCLIIYTSHRHIFGFLIGHFIR